MSFILDALKKSETERQQQAGAEFSSVPSGSREPQSLKWLWFLALLLLVNFAVLIGILMRPGQAPEDTAATEATPTAAAPIEPVQTAQPSFEEQITAARRNQPPSTQTTTVDAAAQTEHTAAQPVAAPRRGRVLTIDEVRVNGTLQVADLHLDIHVYSDDPAERFVFINMTKYREHAKLEEGPVVDEITPDGVILEHQGTTFLLPRE
jgi:general secretion pathway protein B